MSTEIKNTLFRFVTMRAPELLEKKVVDSLFVKHPESELIYPDGYASDFLDAIYTSGQVVDKEFLKTIAEDFSEDSFKTREQVKDFVGANLFDFAIWLTSNRTNFTITEMQERIESIVAGDVKDDGSNYRNYINIWDNLFYQIITFQSGYVREAILSVLVAYFFIENRPGLEEDNLDYLKRLAQARVIIPKMIFGKEQADVDLNKVVATDVAVQPVNTKSLDREMSLILEKQKIDFLKNTINELTIEQNNYNKVNQKAYDIAYSAYQKKIKTLYNKIKTVDKIVLDPVTNEQSTIKEYVNPAVPDFEFKNKVQLDRRRLASKVSPKTLAIVKDLSTDYYYDNFDEVITHIEQELEAVNQNMIQNANLNLNQVAVNGIIIPVSPISNDTPNSFTIGSTGYGFYPTMPLLLLFNNNFDNADVVAAAYTATFENGTTQTGTSFEDTIINNKLSVKIFIEGLNMSQAKTAALSGVFTLR